MSAKAAREERMRIRRWVEWSIQEQGADPVGWIVNLASMFESVGQCLSETMEEEIESGEYAEDEP